jgi:hypothetical protein
MSDQLLRAHEVGEFIFNIADVAYPVSIRDQMNRAWWIVQKAHDLGFFGPRREKKYQRLLICGAGASGVTAAIHAVSLSVETVLVEQSAAPFLRQRHCRSRWIDPTQYDWPAEHWQAGVFPSLGRPAMPLPWRGQRSHLLATGWQPHLRACLARRPRLLTFRRPDRVVGAPARIVGPGGSVAGLSVSFLSGGPPEDFGMMLWCVGFADERRFAPPNYTGFAFWETDPFERPAWGVPRPPSDLRALVSGGGDGALQDVLRLATGEKSAIDVYRELSRKGWEMDADVRHRLFAAEDQAQRALLWCRPRSVEEHRALQELHDAYAVAVADILKPTAPKRDELVANAKRLLAKRPYPVRLVHSCGHFGRCYGLNHFLVLLLSEVVQREKLKHGPVLTPGVGVSRVVPATPGHMCAGSPRACHGEEHDIDLEDRPRCYGSAGGSAGSDRAHVVVPRHGIAPHPAVAGTPLAFARQVMPYHLP